MTLARLAPLRFLALSLLATHAQSPAAATRGTAPAVMARQPVEPPPEWHNVTKWGVDFRHPGPKSRWTSMATEMMRLVQFVVYL